MPTPTEIAEAIAGVANWDARVSLIRTVPERFGTAEHAAVYAAIANKVYKPRLGLDFAYIHWREEYELPGFEAAYKRACEGSSNFENVGVADLASLIAVHPATIRVFRILLGFTSPEFAELCRLVVREHGGSPATRSAMDRAESGDPIEATQAATVALTIDLLMTGRLLPFAGGDAGLRPKPLKPDTAEGWDSVRRYAREGVPFSVFLHQRLYGGAFRQLLDATSSQRGDVLEDRVRELFDESGIPYIQTGSHNQEEIGRRFGLTVRPAPDFVIFDRVTSRLEAILECKVANDGGTARDKASRFRSLRSEANRLGGVPVFAVLGGLGWRRTKDALGPVVRDTDGRTFTVATLGEMVTVEPLSRLRTG